MIYILTDMPVAFNQEIKDSNHRVFGLVIDREAGSLSFFMAIGFPSTTNLNPAGYLSLLFVFEFPLVSLEVLGLERMSREAHNGA